MADQSSDIGAQEHFRGSAVYDSMTADADYAGGGSSTHQAGKRPAGSRPVVVGEEATSAGWGHGPVPSDPRKYKYDRLRAMTERPVQFEATKADRLAADEAGAVLHQIHVAMGIANESEARLAAFDAALWWQHVINGASIMQEMRGCLTVGGMEFDISECLRVIGEHRLRRFFRAYADDIAEVNRTVLAQYSPYDYVAAEKYGQLMQVAAARGLHKYPELAFDAADACCHIGLDARRALMASKALVIPDVNVTDRPFKRVGSMVQTADSLGE